MKNTEIEIKHLNSVTKPSAVYVENTNLVLTFYIDLYYVLENASLRKWESTIGKWNIKYK